MSNRCLAPAVLSLLLALPFAARAQGPPRLVVMLAVDQLRADRVGPELPGGLGRLVREGRWYPDAVLDHAVTETCAGHGTMLTGRHPGATGLTGNVFLDVEAGRRVYCLEDSPERAGVIGLPGEGRSPRNLRVTTLGDWMKQARPATRVFTVAGKDRSAIALGGQHADGVFWFSEEHFVGWTTSRHYAAELPDWVIAFNGVNPPRDGFFAGLPERWEHLPETAQGAEGPDDFPGEASDLSRTSPHPLRDGDLETFAEQLFASPYIDLVTLDFAKELVTRERLGRGEGPDLLGISLSGHDVVGHRYGPNSHEARDALLRIDAAFRLFLEFLESELGEGSVVVALTADHGVLPLPEWLAANGGSECPAASGRSGLKRMGLGLLWNLHWKFSPLSWPESWLLFAGPTIGVKRSLARDEGVEVADVVAKTKAHLEARPAVEHVWTRAEIENGNGEFAELYRHSYDPERTGDLVVQLAPQCLISSYGSGTTHGTPYLYDRAVPLVFFGPGIAPARVPGHAATVDLAPTLARQLGVPAPPNLDGRVLFE
jgi:predicted AlkP superfamily pyrophosphatase or phosphodiesterase